MGDLAVCTLGCRCVYWPVRPTRSPWYFWWCWSMLRWMACTQRASTVNLVLPRTPGNYTNYWRQVSPFFQKKWFSYWMYYVGTICRDTGVRTEDLPAAMNNIELWHDIIRRIASTGNNYRKMKCNLFFCFCQTLRRQLWRTTPSTRWLAWWNAGSESCLTPSWLTASTRTSCTPSVSLSHGPCSECHSVAKRFKNLCFACTELKVKSISNTCVLHLACPLGYNWPNDIVPKVQTLQTPAHPAHQAVKINQANLKYLN